MMPAADKAIYDAMAIVEAEKHKWDHPDYKFKPKRKVNES